MKKIISIVILLFLILCGCTQVSDKPTQPSIAPTEAITVPPTESPTEPPTELPTEPPTEPIISIDMEAGSYLERYEDSETDNYFDYYLHIPNNAIEGMPLFVFLHGDGEVALPIRLENYGPIKAAREIYGEDFPFIAIFPCTRVQSWTNGTIPQTLMNLIDYTVERFQSDTSRIMLTGHSRGSIGVWYLISEYGDYFSCAVPISCGPTTELDYEKCATVPVRAIAGKVGELENRYGYAMKWAVANIVECGGDAEIIVLDNVNHMKSSTLAYTQELFEWMIACEVSNDE